MRSATLGRIVCLLAAVVLLPVVSGSAISAAPELAPNGGFEQGLDKWTAWGTNSDLISVDSKVFRSGNKSARIAAGHNALFFQVPVVSGKAYEVRFFYRLEGRNPHGELALSYTTKDGPHRSGGFEIVHIGPREAGWSEIRRVFMPSVVTASCQLSFSAKGDSILWIDDVSLREVPRPKGLQPAPNPWTGLSQRTAKPLFKELLTDQPGYYTAVCWTHNMNKDKLPEARKNDFPDAESWNRQLEQTYVESAANGMGYMDLPGGISGDFACRTAEFHQDLYEKYGVKFDLWTEGSLTLAEALKLGAEVFNPSRTALGARAVVSLVDPCYVQAQEKILADLTTQFKDKEFVGVHYGKDEPFIRLPDGPPSEWGKFGRQMADEVLHQFGFGRFAAPYVKDPSFEQDPNKPLRWIAYNRWASDRWFATRSKLNDVVHSINPSAVYSPADYWFMSGFVPYDYPMLATCTDMFEIDPYASSAERRRGRGVYNHGFGPKFISDLTGKPVRVIAQAFDYAGYAMKPDDLREWLSQALRCGASGVSYYTLDNPQYNHPARWSMMLHLSKTISNMKRIALPTDPDTAVLYASYTHMSAGASTGADQIYSAHALIGEMAGSWHKFVADTQLERGERSLGGYRAVYLPLGKYMTADAAAKIEAYVRAGGVLVCGDVEAFGSDLQGNDTSKTRERILGVRVVGPKKVDSIRLTKDFVGQAGVKLPLFQVDLWDEQSVGRAREIRILDTSAKVLGTYSDGKAAVVLRRLGKGKVITFAANPFAPEVTVEKTQWPAAFKTLQKNLSCKVDRPIWRFSLPAE